MFTAIKTWWSSQKIFEEWIDKPEKACRISGHNFITEIIRKSIGAICKVVLTSGNCQMINYYQISEVVFSCLNFESSKGGPEKHETVSLFLPMG